MKHNFSQSNTKKLLVNKSSNKLKNKIQTCRNRRFNFYKQDLQKDYFPLYWKINLS